MTTDLAIGIDIGATNFRVDVVHDDGTVATVAREATPVGDGDAVVDRVLAGIHAADRDYLPVGVGVAGIVDRSGRIVYGPNLGVGDLPLGGILEARTARTVVVVNDAAAAALAECRMGAARGADDVVMVTIGTGVGGGLLVAGNIVQGTQGFAAELGHLRVPSSTRRCPCGATGCVEAHASGPAVLAQLEERLDAGEASELADLPRVERDVAALVGAAARGDVLAREVVDDAGRALGAMLAEVVSALDPGAIVLGGGAGSLLASWFIPVVRDAIAAEAFASGCRRLPEVRAAALGDRAGTVGAALLVHEHVRTLAAEA
ncbi:MAG: ROK family protein [Nitriliruptoraceae bacterium]